MSVILHPIVALIILLALAMYAVLAGLVGTSRGRFGVHAPACSGNPEWERRFRVQQNTLEQLILFIPLTILFSVLVNPLFAAILGAIWLVGRVIYAIGYYKDAKLRYPGFFIALAVIIVMLLGNIGQILVILAGGTI